MRAILQVVLNSLQSCSLTSSYWYLILVFVCLPWFCQTLNNPARSFPLSSALCLMSITCLYSNALSTDCKDSGLWIQPPCPLQTGMDNLVANIKLSLGFMWLLPNKFILDQTDFPAYAPDRIFKWCKVGFSNYDPEQFFFPHPLTCNLKINTQAPPGCDNFSKQNWK